MIYDTQSLLIKYQEYSNINQKISLEVKKGNLTRVKRGLYYSGDIKIDGPIIANICLGPSYLSFEYALSYYGLIPEYVSMYTSSLFNHKNNKMYCIKEASFYYMSIPNDVFCYGITTLMNENKMMYKIATKEKALCDELYSKYPVRTIKELKTMLFNDLRIDYNEFIKLDFNFIKSIADLYKSNTLKTLVKYIDKEII